MSSWNAVTYDGKDTVLRVVRRPSSSSSWSTTTGAGRRRPGARHWRVRDVVAHIVDTTEAYFVAFDAAQQHRGGPSG